MEVKIAFIAVMMFITTAAQLTAQEWQTDFEKSRAMATEEGKPIILVFQGSDWCAPCIKLDREVWSTKAFKTYAKKNYIMLKADFPRKKSNALSESQTKANAVLAEKYNKQGYFPFVVVLDSNGNVLGETGYKKTTPEKYIDLLNTFMK